MEEDRVEVEDDIQHACLGCQGGAAVFWSGEGGGMVVDVVSAETADDHVHHTPLDREPREILIHWGQKLFALHGGAGAATQLAHLIDVGHGGGPLIARVRH